MRHSKGRYNWIDKGNEGKKMISKRLDEARRNKRSWNVKQKCMKMERKRKIYFTDEIDEKSIKDKK